MGTVTGYTAEKIQQIEDDSVVGGSFDNGELTLTKGDASTIDVGSAVILTAPNGSHHRIVVANDGTLSTVASP